MQPPCQLGNGRQPARFSPFFQTEAPES